VSSDDDIIAMNRDIYGRQRSVARVILFSALSVCGWLCLSTW